MSVKALTWARSKSLSPHLMSVLLLLADRANRRHEVWVNNRTLAETLKRDMRSVRRNIEALEAQGLLKREPRKGRGGRQTSNLVTLLLPEPSAEDAQAAEIAELEKWDEDNQAMVAAFNKDVSNADITAPEFWKRWGKVLVLRDPEKVLADAKEAADINNGR